MEKFFVTICNFGMDFSSLLGLFDGELREK